MKIFEMILDNVNYIGAVALFLIGLRIVVLHTNLIKRIMGLNIMGTGVFLFFVAIGNVSGGVVPIVGANQENSVFVNPLPSVFILTGIVVVVSITVYSLSLVIRIYENYNTIDQRELSELISEENNEH
ncbi:cation:proton antiporter subunit C [Hujiaoplasma nucleasis]|uniref:Cation:proton antiporter subunit C n=1 Tax=Hujiaoplasma nucleasis TaxID=2725268 RepID=A0A7L6N228_9MOLU|nr:cation:proton antiporter subunit C [Hujiaoplasma nucleasis]QLY40223.1 cation:proton antiporter subunit C [Hujiaoplasma nucleasis]